MQAGMGVRSFGFAIAVCVVLGGCMDHPRWATSVTSTDQVQRFDGYIDQKGGSLQVQVRTWGASCNSEGPWQNLSTPIIASSTPDFTDECGVKWYRYSKDIRLPNNRANWCLSSHQIFWQSDYRILSRGLPVASFQQDAESTCHPTRNCMSNVLSECGSANGVARIFCLLDGSCQVKL